MKTLFELYENHHGKSSDKWSIYLETYHEILFSLQSEEINFLEIGVQNGGSLEIWSKYFINAKNIIGCDIDILCSLLTYDNKNVNVVIGDASTNEVKDQITAIAPKFKVIIDDGSHDSSDIIKSFLLYFPLVENDGYYIIEDLHCSYWINFEGGLYDPFSAMAFLKKLGDIPNFEHWGNSKNEREYLNPFYDHYNCAELDEVDYSEIHSVQFVNSLCIIKKRKKEKNVLGPRVIAGDIEMVVQGHANIHGSLSKPQDQTNNPWCDLPTFPEMEWAGIKAKLTDSECRLNNQRHRIKALNEDLIYQKEVDEDLRQQIQAKDELIARLSHDNHALLNSTSWKITGPLRRSVTQLRRVKRGVDISGRVVKDYGLRESVMRAKTIYNKHGLNGLVNKLKYINQLELSSKVTETKALPPVNTNAEELLMPKVLLIGEMSIPQCKKYRIDQKVELFEKLGIETTVLSWTHQNEIMRALQSHSFVIFYRVPAFESMDRIFDECERLHLTTLWEVDDLIFEADILRQSKTLQALDKATYDGLLNGAALYKRAMLKCSGAIASTQHLADEMIKSGAKYAYVVENALDPETIFTAESITTGRKSVEDGIVRIVYGSGTTTHNIDFLEASAAIVNVLKANKNVHFRLIGHLDLPAIFDEVQSQVERIDLCPYRDYLKVLAECDVSIAPLEDYVFNYSKSNIKYIEAAILSIPSVCSPRPTFSRVINHGENGFLCETTEEWQNVLNELVISAELRQNIGRQAHISVYEHYSPANIAEEQVSLLLKGFKRLQDKRKKQVLSVNCYYNPRSFGGATVVAEELNKRFHEHDEIEIHALTTLPAEYVAPYELRRYGTWEHECYAIGMPPFIQEDDKIVNRNINGSFSEVLDVVQPDVVHFHSIQGMGLTMLEICSDRDIPIIVTAHDYWWLYENQFILSYESNKTVHRFEKTALNRYAQRKRNALSLAHKVLMPSQFSHKLYSKEGFTNIVLNKNGVNYPEVKFTRQAPSVIRFGYVGGNTDIKGFHLIQEAFKNLLPTDVELKIIDNTRNLGFSSFNDVDLANFSNYKLLPAFTQDNLDEFFNGIDVLLNPTQSKESFGLTVREALIRNVWVITSDAGGAAEDIIEGENGLIIPFDNDPAKLKAAVLATIERFRQLPQGDLQDIPHSHIRSFEEQYIELADIYLSAK